MIEDIRKQIESDSQNKEYTLKGIKPIFVADEKTKILIIGQAPGVKTEKVGIPFKDKSGERLIKWLGVSEEDFRNPKLFGILPMDFYYPGRGKSGDKPPRKGFAAKWHPLILEEMNNIELIVLIGNYALDYYLKDNKKKNLTETVRSYKEYLPEHFPIVHPSPLNFRWLNRNPWFEEDIVPELQKIVREILKN